MFEFLIGVIVGAVFSPALMVAWTKVKPKLQAAITKKPE